MDEVRAIVCEYHAGKAERSTTGDYTVLNLKLTLPSVICPGAGSHNHFGNSCANFQLKFSNSSGNSRCPDST